LLERFILGWPGGHTHSKRQRGETPGILADASGEYDGRRSRAVRNSWSFFIALFGNDSIIQCSSGFLMRHVAGGRSHHAPNTNAVHESTND
jgi:hypothetical protein